MGKVSEENNYETKLDELDVKFIAQEHRAYPIITNLVNFGFKKNKKARASWFAFIFNFILTTKTIVIGTSAFVGWFLAFEGNKLLKNQNVIIEKQSELIASQGEYLKNIDKPIVGLRSGGYAINKIKDRLILNYILRIYNFGKRLATNINYRVITLEFDKNTGEFNIIDKYIDENANPLFSGAETKFKMIVDKPINDNDVFVYFEYSYMDVIDSISTTSQLFYYIPYNLEGYEQDIMNARVDEKRLIMEFLNIEK